MNYLKELEKMCISTYLNEEQKQTWRKNVLDSILRIYTKEEIAELKVLEVNAGAGRIMKELAPKVKSYLTLDMSKKNAEKLKDFISTEKLENAEIRNWSLKRLIEKEQDKYDLILINFVYLNYKSIKKIEEIINLSSKALEDGGGIFLGDVKIIIC